MGAAPRIAVAFLLAAAATLAAPGSALALKLVPPGNSGANQYNETLPGPGGNEPTSGVGGRSDRSPGKALGASNASRLEAMGPEGRAAAQLAAKTAPGGTGARRSAGGAEPAGSSGFGEVLRQATGTAGSGGMGLLLPLAIALAAAGSLGFALARRRRTAQGHG